MSLPTTQSNFAQVRAIAATYIEYPFIEQGDSATKIYHMICKMARSDYDATDVDLDDTMASASSAGVIALPFAADSSAYFVGDFNHRPVDGGMVEFERIFANIPATRESFSGTTAYSFPGNKADATDGVVRTISGVSNAGEITTLTCTNTVSVGDAFSYTVSTSSTSGGATFNRTTAGFTYALAGTTSSVVKMPAISILTTFESGQLTELTIQPRSQKSIATGSVTDFTYYLPGVTGGISTFSDVTETDTFAPFSATTGEAANVLSVLTIPDANTYNAQVTAADYLVIESSVTRWMGNIIQRADVKVRAL